MQGLEDQKWTILRGEMGREILTSELLAFRLLHGYGPMIFWQPILFEDFLKVSKSDDFPLRSLASETFCLVEYFHSQYLEVPNKNVMRGAWNPLDSRWLAKKVHFFWAPWRSDCRLWS